MSPHTDVGQATSVAASPYSAGMTNEEFVERLTRDAQSIHDDHSREEAAQIGKYKPLSFLCNTSKFNQITDEESSKLKSHPAYKEALLRNIYYLDMDRSIAKTLAYSMDKSHKQNVVTGYPRATTPGGGKEDESGVDQAYRVTADIPSFFIPPDKLKSEETTRDWVNDIGKNVSESLEEIYFLRTCGRGQNSMSASTITDAITDHLSSNRVDPDGSGFVRWKNDHRDTSVEELEEKYRDFSKRDNRSIQGISKIIFPWASYSRQGKLPGKISHSQEFNQSLSPQDLHEFAERYHEQVDQTVEDCRKSDEQKSTWMPEGMKWSPQQLSIHNSTANLHPAIRKGIESLPERSSSESQSQEKDTDLSVIDLSKALPTVRIQDPSRPLIRRASTILPGDLARSTGMVSDDRIIEPSFTLRVVSDVNDTRTTESLIPRYMNNNNRSGSSFDSASEGKGKQVDDDESSSGEDDIFTFE